MKRLVTAHITQRAKKRERTAVEGLSEDPMRVKLSLDRRFKVRGRIQSYSTTRRQSETSIRTPCRSARVDGVRVTWSESFGSSSGIHRVGPSNLEI